MYKTFSVFCLSYYQKQTFNFLRILALVGLLGNLYLTLLRMQTIFPYFPASLTNVASASTPTQALVPLTPSPARLSRPSDLPTGLYPAYLAARQNRGGTAYNIQVGAASKLTATNPAHNLAIKFSTEGLQIGNLQLQLNRVSYLAPSENENAPSLALQSTSQPQVAGNRVEYTRAANLSEWYVNGPLGLEQSITLHQALPGVPGKVSDQIELQLSLRGVQTAELNATGESLKLILTDGQSLNYGGLYVYDTVGKIYPAHFRLSKVASSEYSLSLIVSGLANKVSYPLTIDPTFSQAQELTASDGAASDYFGNAVALSADGNTALIGVIGKKVGVNSARGAVYVFTRSEVGANYTQMQELIATGGTSADSFGYAVALSSDGNTALIGAYNKQIGANPQQGAAYVFTRSRLGANYTQMQELTATGGTSADSFGYAVALSSDGNTALIGACNKKFGTNIYQGAAYIFTRSGVGASYSQAQELTASDGAADDKFGLSVALSADGNTALIAASQKQIGANSSQGATYIFTRSAVGASYSQAQELTATGGTAYDCFGVSVALSADGNTALIAASFKNIGANSSQGAVYIFTRSGVGASYSQAQELTASDGATRDRFGVSVALSSDGNTALIGAYNKQIGANPQQGAVYAFARTAVASNYSQIQEFTATDGTTRDGFGASVALSADGSTALVGASFKNIGANTYQGAAYIFRPGASVAITSSANTLNYGQNSVVTATVTFPGAATTADTATFYVDNSPVNTQTVSASGVITYGVSGLAVGNHAVYARYNGTAYGVANSAPLTLTVMPTPTAVNLQVAPNPVVAGSSVNFTATLSPVTTGTVSFVITDSNNLAATVPVNAANGVAAYVTNTLAVGSYNVTASFGDNPNYVGSNSSMTNLVVTKAATNLSVTSNPNPSSVGQTVTFTATVTPTLATGTATFTIGAANVTASLTNGVATYVTNTLAVGNYPVIVSYGGDSTYAASTSNGGYTHTVIPACNPLVVTTITDNGAASTCGTFSFALVTATSGQTVTFALTQGNIITFTNSLTPTVPVGVTIDGGATGITLEGNGVAGDGLHLSGNDTLSNLTIRRFAGRELVTLGTGNKLFRVRVES